VPKGKPTGKKPTLKKRELDTSQLRLVKELAGLGFPKDKMASALRVSLAKFNALLKEDQRLGEAIQQGQLELQKPIMSVGKEMALSGENWAATKYYIENHVTNHQNKAEETVSYVTRIDGDAVMRSKMSAEETLALLEEVQDDEEKDGNENLDSASDA